MRQRFWSALVCGALWVGCAGSSGALSGESPPAQEPAGSTAEAPPPAEVAPDAEKKDLLPLEVTDAPAARDPINIVGVSVEGDVLALYVSHGGGCRQHGYGLQWTGQIQDQAAGTPRVELTLVHDANGDLCKRFVRETLRFDLSSLRQRWLATSGAEHGVVQLELAGPSGQFARYAF